ncbi:hypothetical protein [Marivita sp.]|uniref:hypothetical protein n=1 Tax=Marivita sp. TaxID=2003365 RepID=UPI0025BEF9FB|nr:hypothetical protein [Marivita sp.]
MAFGLRAAILDDKISKSSKCKYFNKTYSAHRKNLLSLQNSTKAREKFQQLVGMAVLASCHHPERAHRATARLIRAMGVVRSPDLGSND